MQLRYKLLYLSVIFPLLIGVAGGVTLLMDKQASTEYEVNALFYWFCSVAFLICVVHLIVVRGCIRNTIRRLGEMQYMVESAGSGKFGIRLDDNATDELGDLARMLNETADYLALTREGLEKSRQELFLELKEREAIEKRLADAATHDALTGLPNRKYFSDHFSHVLALAERHQSKVALLFIDMDGLKIVNDAFGHDGGDMLIQQVAKRLQNNIRKSDYVARLAGDEFVIVLEQIKAWDEDVSLVCEKLLGVLAEPYDIRGRRIKLTASIGASLFPEHGRGADELLHKADSAMYWVKNTGKNNFAVYDFPQNKPPKR